MNYEQSLFLTISQPKTDKTVVNSLPFFKKKVISQKWLRNVSELHGNQFSILLYKDNGQYLGPTAKNRT